MLYSEWLSIYKKSSSNDCVFRLSKSPALQNICIAWRSCSVDFPLDRVVTDFSKTAKAAAWEFVKYDALELSEKSGLSIGFCGVYVRQAIALDMIYPDGTLNHAAEKLLSAIIAKSIKEAAK